MTEEDEIKAKDSSGNILQDGDAVQLIKDLPVKGSSIVLKRGTIIKGIRLTSDPNEIDCRAEKVKNLVLKTMFVKKV
jgi:protein PhnA